MKSSFQKAEYFVLRSTVLALLLIAVYKLVVAELGLD